MNNTQTPKVQTKQENFMDRNTFGSKSILARLLSTENLTVEHRSDIDTAMFDTENRMLYLPCWENMNNDTYDMLIGHEVGHALFTPAGEEAIQSAIDYIDSKNPMIVKGFLNIVEDARIERLMKAKYPGLAINFRNAYIDMYENDMFDIKQSVAAGRKVSLIDRLNIRAKCGMFVNNISTLDEDEEYLYQDMLTTESFDDVIRLTKTIYDLSRKPKDPPQQNQQQKSGVNKPKAGGGSGTGRGGSGAAGKNQGPMGDNYVPPTEDDVKQNGGNGSEDSSSGGNANGEEESQENNNQSNNNQPQGKGEEEAQQQEEETVAPDAPATGGAHNKLSKQSTNKKPGKVNYVVLPSNFDIDSYIVDHTIVSRDFAAHTAFIPMPDKYAAWRNDQMRSISTMVKEFDLRKAADAQSRTSVSRSGVIDCSRLMNYKWSEDVFRRNTTIRAGKNHGMIMVIDWSGSMSNCIADTIRQTMLMALFCRQVNIPFAVYCFSDVHGNSRQSRNNAKDTSRKQVLIDNVSLIEWLNSEMNNRQFHEAMVRLFTVSERNLMTNPSGYGLGGTPLCQTAVLLRYLIPSFQKKHNVQIMNAMVLTDGEDTSGVYSTGHANSFTYGSDSVLRDDRTRMQTAISTSYGEYRIALQKILELVRETTYANLIGFYLVGRSGALNMALALAGGRKGNKETAAIEQVFKKTLEEHKYAEVKGTGYDSYFVVPSDSISIEDDEDFSKKFVEKDLTKGRIASNFAKALTKKRVGRIFLQRLVDAMSKDHSKENIHTYRKNNKNKVS